ncbi:MAG: ABC transporter permease [Deltaproteobacteria bacterium]|nr:ABC transporter permease [Deltaproteobacteria bacterium]
MSGDPATTTRPTVAAMPGSVWRARTVVRALVVRDLRGRYVGSALGLVWSVVNPLAQLAIFTFVFSTVLSVRFEPSDVPFVLYLAAALFPWLAFQESVLRSATCLVDNSVLVKRVVFPIEVLPVQIAISALVHQLIALALLLVLMVILGVPPQASVLALPPLLVVQLLLTVGIGWAVAALHVYFRDTAQVLGVVFPMWFYLTPIIYPYRLVPEALRPVLALNPLTALVEAYRDVLLHGVVPLGVRELWLAIVSVAVFAAGAAIFTRARGELSDLV